MHIARSGRHDSWRGSYAVVAGIRPNRRCNGKALIATGLPYDPVEYEGTSYEIGQANNALLYPGLGLGVIVSRAKLVTDRMITTAAEAVAGMVDTTKPGAGLLPDVRNLRVSSATIAVAVVKAAVGEGVARTEITDVVQQVQDAMWQPVYSPSVEANGA